MNNALGRAVSLILCCALLWTAPGSAAYAAAGSALRANAAAARGVPASKAETIVGIKSVAVSATMGVVAGWQAAVPANQASMARPTGFAPVLVPSSLESQPAALRAAGTLEPVRAVTAAADQPNATGQNLNSTLSKTFDGAKERRLHLVEPPQAGQGSGEDAGPASSRPSGPRVRVAVDMLELPTPQAQQRLIEELQRDVDFQLEFGARVKAQMGTLTFQGHIPAANVKALVRHKGVLGVENLEARESVSVPSNHPAYSEPVTTNYFHQWMHGSISGKRKLAIVVGVGLVLYSAGAIVGPVGLAAMMATTGFKLLPGLASFGVAWAAVNAGLTVWSMFRWHKAAKTLPRNSHADIAAISGTGILHTALLLTQFVAVMAAGVLGNPFWLLVPSSLMLMTLLMKKKGVLAGPPAPEPGDDGEGVISSVANFASRAVSFAGRREPFIPAMKKVLELETLAKNDPAAAFKKAKDYVSSATEKRREIKLAALRIIEELPLKTTLSWYRETLESFAAPRLQAAKKDGKDGLWYVQRNILLHLSAVADAHKAELMELAPAIKGAAQDRNPSVRLAARALAAKLGVDPGPEPDYGDNRLVAPEDEPKLDLDKESDTGVVGYHDPNKPAAPGVWGRVKKAIVVAMIIALPLGIVWSMMPAPKPAPKAPTQITQPVSVQKPAELKGPNGETIVIKAPDAKAGETAAKAPEQAPDRMEQIAKNTERNAKASESIADSLAKLNQKLDKAAAAASSSSGSGIGSMILNAVIFIALFIGISMLVQRFFMNRGGGGGQNGIGPNNGMNSKRERPNVRFEDVEGMDETIVEVEETVDFMRDPKRFKAMGMRMPKGLLFEGPPGTGKTMLAKALAGEINANFFAVSGSEFVELYVGQGAARVRKLFADAKKAKPAVIFIDEIDAVGKKRGVNVTGGNDEREQTLNQILTEMQGFEEGEDIIVVAATNRMDTLDDALLRPGRFDYKVHVGKPHMNGREAILTVHTGKKPLAPDVDLRFVARRTTGLAGAELEGIMNHAAKFALRRNASAIAMEDIDRAIDTVTIGDQRNLLIPDLLKKRIAYHEAGHALATLLHEKPELRRPVNKFTIIPRDRALGFAEIGDAEGDSYLYTKSELEARIDVMVGGMVAEKLLFGEWSTGPDNDLERATQMARMMVERLGMSESMGLAQTVDNQTGRRPFGDGVGDKAHAEVNRLMKEAFARTEARLTRNKHVLDALVKAVYEKETLLEDQILEAIKQAGPVYK